MYISICVWCMRVCGQEREGGCSELCCELPVGDAECAENVQKGVELIEYVAYIHTLVNIECVAYIHTGVELMEYVAYIHTQLDIECVAYLHTGVE